MEIDYVGKIWAVAVTMNLALSVLSKALDLLKNKLSSNLENKLVLYIHNSASFLQKVIDWASANRSHLNG